MIKEAKLTAKQMGTIGSAVQTARAMQSAMKGKPFKVKQTPQSKAAAQRAKLSPSDIARAESEQEEQDIASAAPVMQKMKSQQAAHTRKTQPQPQPRAPGIFSELKNRLDQHSRQEFLHNQPINFLLNDLGNIQHQLDVAHAQGKIEDSHHRHYSGKVDRTRAAHIKRASFDNLQQAVESGSVPVSKELLDTMHGKIRTEAGVHGDYRDRIKQAGKIEYLNNLAHSIGIKPKVTPKKKFLGLIPYGKEKIEPVYEAKKHSNSKVKVTKSDEQYSPNRIDLDLQVANPESGTSSGQVSRTEQTVNTIKDVIMETRFRSHAAPKARNYGRRRAAVYVSSSYEDPATRIRRYQSRSRRQRVGQLIRRFH